MKRSALLSLALLLIAISAGVWYYLAQTQRGPASAPPAASASVPAPVPAEPATSEPTVDPAAPPLPALADSDPAANAAIVDLIGAEAAGKLLLTENMIRRSVATIDNLSRRRLNVDLRPWRPAAGAFLVSGDDERAIINEANYSRYDAAVAAFAATDVARLAAAYRRFYPLLQRAYQDQGYPDGRFDRRLVQTIDHLLATPRPKGNIELRRPNVFWQFADPTLEALSAGQKLLLRIGPTHRQAVEAQLQRLRAELTRVQ